jgi:hypothetical protein
MRSIPSVMFDTREAISVYGTRASPCEMKPIKEEHK